jgi:periplasmic protein TonB
MGNLPGQRSMVTTTHSKQPETTALPSSHLTVRPDSDGPREVRFMFDQPDGARIGRSLGAGLVTEAVVVGIVLLVMSFMPKRVYEAVLPDRLSEDIVWLSQPGPGGGGGGGNKMPDPPKKAELKGEQKISVPTPPKPEPTPEPPKVEPPPETLNIPAQTLAAAPVITPGALTPNPADTNSTGSGSGTGAGSGQGSGLGAGFGGGTGGGAFKPGNGVNLPQPLKEVKPQYTADAMRAKVQGTVLLECVVLPDGSVGSVEVVRSLDSAFGLDQEAIKAAKQWRFKPGTRFGEPVAVLVTIELTFTLR